MAGILDPLQSGVSDLLTPILNPTDSSTPDVSVSIVTVPVTVSVTVSDPPTSTSTTSSSSTTHTASNSTTSTLSSTSISTNTTDPDFITTTYLTQDGSAMVTVTAVVQNPAHLHNNQDLSNGSFFSNHTAVIGVFTAVGIIGFVMIAGVIMWIARRRTLKKRQRELAEKNSRDFFQDEVNDQDEPGAPSEKSWWGNASGASIPETGGVPLQVVTSNGYNNMPPMPALPSEYSHSSALKTPISESDGGMTIHHPYASATPSVISDPYTTLERNTSFSTRITSPAQSPPPGIPVLPYRNPSTSTNGKLSHIDEIRPLSPPVPNHPFASPPSNRKSELFPEEVLWNLGSQGGVGRSLSGRREPEPPVPARQTENPASRPLSPQTQQPPSRAIQQLTEALNQPQTLLYVADDAQDKSSPHETVRTTTTAHSAANLSNMRPRPVSAISEGGWYDDSNSEVGKAPLAGATASGESFLNTANGRNDRFGYPYSESRANQSQSSLREAKSAATSTHDVSERPAERKIPHDPRYSGLFGNMMASNRSEGRQSEDFDEYEDQPHGKNGNRTLRVTNE